MILTQRNMLTCMLFLQLDIASYYILYKQFSDASIISQSFGLLARPVVSIQKGKWSSKGMVLLNNRTIGQRTVWSGRRTGYYFYWCSCPTLAKGACAGKEGHITRGKNILLDTICCLNAPTICMVIGNGTTSTYINLQIGQGAIKIQYNDKSSW